jgi:hypothetical protein
MARFYGAVGFDHGYHEKPNDPSVYDPDRMVERYYFGDVVKHTRKWENDEGKNDDLNITNRISIVADDYTVQHCSAIRYVKWAGACWKVVSMDVERPRIILTLGGVWNGDTA